MGETIIERVFLYASISTIIIIVGLIGLFFFLKWALKVGACPKWSHRVCMLVAIVVVVVSSIALTRIYSDIKNEDYVTYCGEYIERGGGQRELKTVVIYDDLGKEIKLLRTGASRKGVYEGTVIYGRCSKIVVEYSGELKE